MNALTQKFFSQLPIQLVWFFLTEQCQLSCEYCFFQERSAHQTMSLDKINNVLSHLPLNRRYDFILSGGEPLLVWDLLVATVHAIRQRNQNDSITVQTNGLLIDLSKILFFQKNRVDLEISLDGISDVHLQYRYGMKQKDFDALLKHIQQIQHHNLVLRATMTVHPGAVLALSSNFQFLLKQGLSNIDVHPAFLAHWQKEDVPLFLQQYQNILQEEQAQAQHRICKSYSIPITKILELIVLPSGQILPHWTCLTFPHSTREDFHLLFWQEGQFQVQKPRMKEYLQDWQEFFIDKKTYRDFCLFNAERILNQKTHQSLRQQYQVYKQLCLALQSMDQQYLTSADYYEA